MHVRENLYVIGTMNIADLSLALVDMAFRRRFAFVDLEPCHGTTWREWVVGSLQLEASAADTIQLRHTTPQPRHRPSACPAGAGRGGCDRASAAASLHNLRRAGPL